jgi:hypothetical protein
MLFKLLMAYEIWLSMAISYIAIRSVDDIPSCDGGNINSYKWLNSCINVSNCWYNCFVAQK